MKKSLWPQEEKLNFGKAKAKIKDPFRLRFEEFLKQSCDPEIGQFYKPVAGTNREHLPNDDDTLFLLDAQFGNPEKVGYVAEYSPGTETKIGWTERWNEEIKVVLLTFLSMKTQAKIKIGIDAAMFSICFEKINP